MESAVLLFEENFGPRSFHRKTVVFIPDSPKFFEKLEIGRHAEGFFQALPSRDYIVLRRIKNWEQALLHEFAHLWMHPKASKWPSWFREGMAVYYEQFLVERGLVIAGLVQSGHLQLLGSRRWLPIRTVFQTAHPSAIKDVVQTNLFYAQAWAIVHMLRLSPEYAQEFGAFQEALTAGASTEEALRQVYGITVEKLEEEVRRWVRKSSWPVQTLSASGKKNVTISISAAPTGTVELVTSTLKAVRSPEGERERVYQEFAGKYSGDCVTEVALGDLAFNLRLLSHAARHYRKAVECGTPPETLGRGIELASWKTAGTVGHEAFPGEGDWSRSRRNLESVVARFFANDFQGVVQDTQDLSGFSSQEVFRASRLRAIALAQVKRFDEALEIASKLESLASDEFERVSAALTLEDVKRAKGSAQQEQLPVDEVYLRRFQRLEGVLTRVDCMGKTARLWIETGRGESLKFQVSETADVVTGLEDSKPLEVRCGPQRTPVLVGYETDGQSDSETSGRLRYLRLRDP
ncbi:MAG: hypothetical protein RMK57_08200 [Bryobacterales bacterium]|nr:hypothetical protein [Bryobacterales bacterium]